VFLRVLPHECFERDGKDLYCAIPISITQAALGADIVVPTLDDKTVRVAVPAGTQNGRILRLRGEGVPELHSPSRRGDLYIKIVVKVPTKLSAKAKELLKELSTANGEDHTPKPIPLSELKQ
jgi:molecular chaperone DnaJ